MNKVRVHELAKEFNLPSKDMVTKMQELGLNVKNHMSTIEASQAEWVRKKLREQEKQIGDKKAVAPSAQPVDAKQTPDKPTGQQVEPAPKRDEKSAISETKITRSGDHEPSPVQNENPAASTNRQASTEKQVPSGEKSHPSKNTQQGRIENREARTPAESGPARTADANRSSVSPDRTIPVQLRNNMDRRPVPQGQMNERRPAGQPAADRRSSGHGYQDKKPQVQTGQAHGRPQGHGGYGDRRSQGQPNFDKKGQGQSGAPFGDRRPTRPGGQGDRRPPAQGSARGPKIVVPPAPVVEEKPRKSGPPSKDKEKDFMRKQIEKRARSDKEISRILEESVHRGRPKNKKKNKQGDNTSNTPEVITILDKVSVRELAEQLNKSPAELVKKLFNLGIMVTVNQEIDFDVAEIVCSEYDVRVERGKSEEEQLIEEIIDPPEKLKPRPPVVTVMGHVDHGKTSLLDALRQTNVVANEAGGITQHIGAYQVLNNGNRITFIDTPGHEAFTAMRMRGAMATDIAVLVVAADDGVMPQTLEAISHARAADVPIIVAINKIDKENANPDRVKQQLAEQGLVPEEWGGDTICVPVSAKAKIGLDHLLEMILLVAEMREISANPDRPAEGVVLEGQLDRGRGPVASVLVQKGTLRVGDTIICGNTWGKIRAMTDEKGQRVNEALPSTPVELQGLNDVPMAGDTFRVVDEKIAKQVAEIRQAERKREEQAKTARVSLDDFFKQMGDTKELNLIIKGDVQGSVEALAQSLERLSTDEVKVNVIHSGVGAINESDVMLASTSNGIIIGFNVRPDAKARKAAEEEHIDVRLYRVIYEALDDVKKAMSGLLEPEHREVFQGTAEVRAVFKVPKAGNVAGAYVTEGKITRQSNVRVLREGVIVYEGKLASLKRFKDDVREVVAGYECGIGIEDFNDIKEGDVIEAYIIEDVPREL